MQFHDVAKTWKESINLLAWKELRLLVLASLNNFSRALKLTIKYFWWLLAAWIALLILPTIFHVVLSPHQIFDAIILEKIPTALPPSRLYDIPRNFWTFTVMGLAFSAINGLLYFSFFLSTRASVERKDFAYYVLYSPKILLFWISQLLMGFCLAPLALIPSLCTENQNISSITGTIVALLFSALPALTGYAFFDHEKKPIRRALKTGLIFFVCFLPILAIFSFTHMLILFFLYGVTMLTLSTITMPFLVMGIIFGVFFIQTAIISLLFLSCFSTLYIKIKHAHPNLFFM